MCIYIYMYIYICVYICMYLYIYIIGALGYASDQLNSHHATKGTSCVAGAVKALPSSSRCRSRMI